MVRLLNKVSILLYADLFLLLVAGLGAYQIVRKPWVPFELEGGSSLVISSRSPHVADVQSGHRIIAANGIPVKDKEELEIVLDSEAAGELATFAIKTQETVLHARVPLIHFYSPAYVILVSFTAIAFIIIALFVVVRAENARAALVFHWATVGPAILMLTTWGSYAVGPEYLRLAPRILFHIAYVGAPLFFLHFTYVFPNTAPNFSIARIVPLYVLGFCVAAAMTISFLLLDEQRSLITVSTYNSWFNGGRLLAALGVLGALVNFVVRYNEMASPTAKKQMRWILLGFIIGPLMFIVLWVVPQGIFGSGLVPEEIILALMCSVPVTFGIAIVRYHIMDVDLIINRSVVYGAVLVTVALLYVVIVSLIGLLIEQTGLVSSVLAASVVAFLFQPMRSNVQHFIDRKFFKIQFNFRQSVRKLTESVVASADRHTLAATVIAQLNELVPVNVIGFYLFKQGHRLSLLAEINDTGVPLRMPDIGSFTVIFDSNLPGVRAKSAEPGLRLNYVHDWGMQECTLLYPVFDSQNRLKAFLALGDKKSGFRFAAEDIDLYSVVVGSVAEVLERIEIQERLIRKQIEAEHLQELHRLQSIFMAGVTHDLKTPLTSIKLFAELLQRGKIKGANKRAYGAMIENEADRLSRLIETVLEYANIERGRAAYSLAPVSLDHIVKDSVRLLSVQAKLQKFKIRTTYSHRGTLITADAAAIERCIVNLISNAIKYGGKSKRIVVKTGRKGKWIFCSVSDNGIGIPKESLPHVFAPFYRAPSGGAEQKGGVGLGLAVVDSVMKAHKGRAEVTSREGKGSTFTLLFPMRGAHEENSSGRR